MSSKSNKSMKSNNNYLVDQNKFYKIKANITGNSLVHVSGFNKDYVEYNICIKTIYGKWTFKRTYDEFCKLNNKLVNKVPEIKDLFPPKRFFKNSENTIKERVKYFNKYIKFLFNKVNIFSFDDIINFFYIEKGIIGLIIKKYNMLKIGEENYIYTSLNEEFNKKNKKEEEKDKKISYQNIRDEDIINILNNENYYNAILQYEQKRQISFDWDEPNDITPNTFVIREFINNLSEKIENKADIIQNFENFLQKQTKWIKLSKKEITELFIGYEDEEDVEEDDFNRTRTLEIEENNTKHSLFKWFEKKKNSKTIESDDDDKEPDPRINFEQISRVNQSRPQTSYGGLNARRKNLQSAMANIKNKANRPTTSNIPEFNN